MASLITDSIVSMVMHDIASRQEWSGEVERGKMFGILMVKGDAPLVRQLGDGIGILLAYSGQIYGRSDWEGYVPAIFDYLQPEGYFKQHEAGITALNQKVREAEAMLPKGKRSAEVESMKAERKEASNALQRWLFSQFVLRGYDGSSASVLKVFGEYAETNRLKQQLPPGGTGECCAPKLLHYANSNGLQPLELVEFWYGNSPKGEVRHHGHFYEPCQAKCMPILWYLSPKEGLRILGGQPAIQQTPQLSLGDILYEDDWLIAIDKPAKLLSVPGKRQLPNAEDMLKELRRDCAFLKMTHRLDMDTSGVLLAAKDEETFCRMQRLFAAHETVSKEYVAILCEDETKRVVDLPEETVVKLPLSADFLNRPRQCVDYVHGKEAFTKVVRIKERWVSLFPLTGRTHQLRIHCAHIDGLGMPILGDPLYGNTAAGRMFLHARRLEFVHPVTGERVKIESEIPEDWNEIR